MALLRKVKVILKIDTSFSLLRERLCQIYFQRLVGITRRESCVYYISRKFYVSEVANSVLKIRAKINFKQVTSVFLIEENVFLVIIISNCKVICDCHFFNKSTGL